MTARALNVIDAEMEQLRTQRAALHTRLRELQQERDVAVAAAKLEQMNPAERAALAQALAPSGIPSAEKVGGLGGG